MVTNSRRDSGLARFAIAFESHHLCVCTVYIYSIKDSVKYLTARSTSLSRRNCPARQWQAPRASSSTPVLRETTVEEGGQAEGKTGKKRDWLTERARKPAEKTVRHPGEKKTIRTRRLISEALPPAPFTTPGTPCTIPSPPFSILPVHSTTPTRQP